MPRKKAAANQLMSFDDLFELREQTEKVSKFLHDELLDKLQTLWPLLAAKRIFGQHLNPREPVKGADEAFNEIQKRFNAVRENPYGLMGEMSKQDLGSVGAGMVLTPWQYEHIASVDGQETAVQVTSPNKWHLSFKSDYTLPQLTKALQAKEDLWPGPTREFIVNSLAMDMVVKRNPGVVSILDAVGFQVASAKTKATGELPLVTVESNLKSSLPPDELLVKAARFSGVAAFNELIDAAAIDEYEDPFSKRLRALVE